MKAIETIERGNLRAHIYYDDDPADSPRDYDGCLAVMAFEHARYALGDAQRSGERGDAARTAVQALNRTLLSESRQTARNGRRIVERWLRVFMGATYVQWVGLIDHSGIALYLGGGSHPQDGGGWDSGTIGVMFDTTDTRAEVQPDDVEQHMRAEFDEYNCFVRGEVYGFEIVRVVTCDYGDEHEEELESYWGYIGDDHVKSEANYQLDHFEKEVAAA